MADAQALERQERSLEGAQVALGLRSVIKFHVSEKRNAYLRTLHGFPLNQTICHQFLRCCGTWSMFRFCEASWEVLVSAALKRSNVPTVKLVDGYDGYERFNPAMAIWICGIATIPYHIYSTLKMIHRIVPWISCIAILQGRSELIIYDW